MRPFLVHPGRSINHEIEAGLVGAWPLSNVPIGPVLQKLCTHYHDTARTYFSKPKGYTPGEVGLKCRVEACSTPVPARSMHGQPLTGHLPVSQILGFQVSGRARRKLTKWRKFPSSGPDGGARRFEGAVPPAQCPSGLLRGTVEGSIDSPRVVCVSQSVP